MTTTDTMKLPRIFAHAIFAVSAGAVFISENSPPSLLIAEAYRVFPAVSKKSESMMLKHIIMFLPVTDGAIAQ